MKLSEPDLSTKFLRLSVSSFMVENSPSQPSRLNVEPLYWIWNCLELAAASFFECRKDTRTRPNGFKVWHQLDCTHCDQYLISAEDGQDDVVIVDPTPTYEEGAVV